MLYLELFAMAVTSMLPNTAKRAAELISVSLALIQGGCFKLLHSHMPKIMGQCDLMYTLTASTGVSYSPELIS